MIGKDDKKKTPRPVAAGLGERQSNCNPKSSGDSIPQSGRQGNHAMLKQWFVKVFPDGCECRFLLSGQTARTLEALINADNGITALEVSSWAFRLSAYIFDLRKLGLEISMEHEEHAGGWHGRYFLLSDCRKCDGEER